MKSRLTFARGRGDSKALTALRLLKKPGSSGAVGKVSPQKALDRKFRSVRVENQIKFWSVVEAFSVQILQKLREMLPGWYWAAE